MNREKVIILDFGSQYTQLIARRVRENSVYCEIMPYNALKELDPNIVAVILSGSPRSVKDSPRIEPDFDVFLGKVPVLSICYGAQLIASMSDGVVEASEKREFGKAVLNILSGDKIFDGLDTSSQVWMSHGDTIKVMPGNFTLLANTSSIPVAAFRYDRDNVPVYGLQFHPEVTHSIDGNKIISNFLRKVCGIEGDWTPAAFVEEVQSRLREHIGDKKVLMAVSGGVDSSVAAFLIHKAIGKRLKCVFVNNGLLRKNEYQEVLNTYKNAGLNVEGIEAEEAFYKVLDGVKDPELKRKNIGKKFIDLFQEFAVNSDGFDFLGQGTIYPDVIESVSVNGPSAVIKSHHNVGGLPEKMELKLVEPLRNLFKDEVRKIGAEVNLPTEILNRHPFPGPGLGIRILGVVNAERVALLQEADDIYITKLKEWGLYDEVWQAGAILLPIKSVGVMGDERTFEHTVALRAVSSTDGMTADWSRLPQGFLAEVSGEIINNVKGINRVVYDISTKPPATIEWE